MKDNATITLTSKPRKGGGDPEWTPPLAWTWKLKYGDETFEGEGDAKTKEIAAGGAFAKYDELVRRDTYELSWRMKDARLPKDLHKRLVWEAKQLNVSLNTEIVNQLTREDFAKMLRDAITADRRERVYQQLNQYPFGQQLSGMQSLLGGNGQ